MRDWRQLVQQRLAGLAIEHGEPAQVVEEPATHLEEKYRALLKDGVSEELAARRALNLAGDWQERAEKIVSACGKERTMRDRLARVWLPGLLSTILTMGSLAVIQMFAAPSPMVRDYRNNAARLWLTPAGVLSFTLVWILFCAAALLAGGLPVQLLSARRATPAAKAIN